MTREVRDPIDCGDFIIGHCDEIHGHGGKPSKAQVTNYEIEALCWSWAETVAHIEANLYVFGGSGSWEERIHPYGLNRLDYFKQFVGAERVDEILERERQLTTTRAKRQLDEDLAEPLYIRYALEEVVGQPAFFPREYEWREYEEKRKESIPWDDLDSNIVPLIRALNNIPGCITWGSCGGHAEKAHAGQADEGYYFVGILFTQDPEGWWSLTRLANALEIEQDVYCSPVESDGLLRFWLAGKGDPARLADLLSDENWQELNKPWDEDAADPGEAVM